MAAPPSTGLLGPPEIRRNPPQSTPAATGVPFIDLMDSSFNNPNPPMGRTENNSATCLSSGNACLDFFFQVVPSTPSATAVSLLTAAWRRDPLTALKLVCHLRGVRGTGKSDRERFYSCALWLHKLHPKTLALNVPSIAQFGYMKDLLEILFRLIDGPESRRLAKQESSENKMSGVRRWRFRGHAVKRPDKKGRRKKGSREDRIAAELARLEIEMKKPRDLRQQKRSELAIRATSRYSADPEYRFLHDRISEFFAELLAADLEQLNAGKPNKIGLAAKWCPSLDSSFDRYTLLCESIARRMFPRESNPDYMAIEEEHYAYRVRDRLRREVLVPLRKVLELPEIYMSAGQWDALPYNRVASVAMKRYKAVFKKHDEERFTEYLSKVEKGEAKIAAGALLPHEILKEAVRGDDRQVAELQWQRMVSDLLAKGKLKNCISVCDVSGSMNGEPMEVCIALGILISELSEEPWKGRVITFSHRPQMHLVRGWTLGEKRSFVERMEWNMNTDFQKVFDEILRVAVAGRLEPEKMIKTIFVFSDMEFDQASSSRHWETDYEVICRKFRERGYGDHIPQIVFWNLRDSRSTPVPSRQKGVALVSGFSKNLVKIFLEGAEGFDPVAIMEAAISGEEYKKLVVFD